MYYSWQKCIYIIFSFFHQSHPGNSISIDLESRQTGCTRWYIKKTAGNSRRFLSVYTVKILDTVGRLDGGDVWGGTNHMSVHLCMRMRVWYQENKSIQYEKGEKVCLSCLGFSLGSCLLTKVESITQCVLCRMCGLKDGMGLWNKSG